MCIRSADRLTALFLSIFRYVFEHHIMIKVDKDDDDKGRGLYKAAFRSATVIFGERGILFDAVQNGHNGEQVH